MKRRALTIGFLVAVLFLAARATGWGSSEDGLDDAPGRARSIPRANLAVREAGGDLGHHLGITDLEYAGHTADDDNSGQSSGNSDGIVNCGEVIELYVHLHNPGFEPVFILNATINSGDAFVVGFGNTESSYPSVAPLETETNYDAFVFEADCETPDGHLIPFDLDVTATDGSSTVYFDVPVSRHCAADVDCDADVDVADVTAVAAEWRSNVGPESIYDLDGDGTVTVVDIMLVASQWQSPCP
jgi:hypothetical protein